MNNMKKIISLTLLLLFGLAAVNGQTKRRKAGPRGKAARPAMAKTAGPVSITMPSGLTYLVTQHGTGAAVKTGQTVTVHYTGLLTDGTKFDSSRDGGSPFTFPLGAGKVIKGWDEGVAQLHVGDQAMLIIPPDLGYGARGAGGVIPPNATLIFIIEVVSVK